MGCRSSQKKFQRYRPKIDVQRKIFVFDPIYKGKRAKISPKINKIEIWLKSGPKVINSPNQSHRDHIWGMFELKKWSYNFDFATRSAIFCGPKTVTFAKSTHF